MRALREAHGVLASVQRQGSARPRRPRL